ncbi:MAG TPA: hypothetical protein VGK73_35475, partial [Polyangiaceae bacterium]
MRRKRPLRAALSTLLLAAFAASAAPGCAAGTPRAQPPLGEFRAQAKGSQSGETVGRWLLGELVSPGGTAAQAELARQRLDGIRQRGLLASFARGFDDSVHGRLTNVSEHYLAALEAARTSSDPRAQLFAWIA